MQVKLTHLLSVCLCVSARVCVSVRVRVFVCLLMDTIVPNENDTPQCENLCAVV